MTPEEINLVQKSFEKVLPAADSAATIFYGRLFAIAPDTRALFPEEMVEQRNKLTQALSFVVAGLHRPEKILPTVRELGRNHTAYGVTDDHYRAVGAALIDALELCLAGEFTSEVKAAWTSAYGALSDEMKSAAAEAAA